MALVLNTNKASNIAQRSLTKANTAVDKSIERLSTGYKINHASDGAANLSLAQVLKTQLNGTMVASENTTEGVNLLQTAEGDLSTIQDNLQRIRELTVQAASDTYSSSERNMMATEVKGRLEEITRIANASKFSNIQLLDGSTTDITLQVGADSGSNSQLNVGSALIDAKAVSLNSKFNDTDVTTAFSSASNANAFISEVDNAITKVSNSRSNVGVYQNRLETTLDNLTIRYENVASSLSTIQDTDIASETANLTKQQILQQVSTSMLSIANQNSALALNLL